MGEIAEAMLDGTMCAVCGVYLGNDLGVPMYCKSCGKDEKMPKVRIVKEKDVKYPCYRCGTKLPEHKMTKRSNEWFCENCHDKMFNN